MKNNTPPPVLLKSYRPPAYLVDSVHLNVILHPTAARIIAKLTMRPNPAAKGRRVPLVLDGEDLGLDSIRLDGRVLAPKDYKLSPVALTVPGVPQGRFVIETSVTCNPEANTKLSGLYRSRGVYCTQCEAEGFRRITYFPDRPDVLATYTTRIEADREEAGVLLSNGNPSERGTLDGGRRHYAVWKDPHPKPCYLFALVGGNLSPFGSSFTTMSGRPVDLRIYVESGKEARAAWAMDALKRSMKWDEDRFGREYDLAVFNIVAVSDFNMGAMENKGLNIFNDRLVLATPETATDQNFADIERVIAHEYFHNWTGNRITCRDWFQLCLKEGLTVYRDQEFSADMRSRAVQRIADVRNLKSRQFPEDAGPLAHAVRPDRYVEINNFYTATVYEKGAELVRMLAALLGPADFRTGMDLYFERHDGSAATVEDFIACFAETSGRDFRQFMAWYAEAGTPELVCSLAHDPATRTATLTVEQVIPPTPGQPNKKPRQMPLRLGLVGGNGHDIELKPAGGGNLAGGILEIRKRSESFRFLDVPARPVVSLNRGFSAPVNLTIAHDDADLAFLIAHDNDPFNRWQASHDYAMRVLVAATGRIRAGKRPAAASAFIAALGAAIADETLEPAFRGQLLTLPGEGDVARAIGRNVDPHAIHKAAQWLARAIADALDGDLADLYARCEVKGVYAPSPEQTGRRLLRNRVLAILAARAGNGDVARLSRHFATARNATDETAALALLGHVRGAARKAAFDAYYRRWHGDHLVIDNWFTYQAASSLPGTLAAVEKLTGHALFSLLNPNKVRALLLTFATANPVNFNAADGSGYGFVAAKVAELDAINPQVAARLLGAFRSWRTLEPGLGKLAGEALAGLARTRGVSRDVGEILGKILD